MHKERVLLGKFNINFLNLKDMIYNCSSTNIEILLL